MLCSFLLAKCKMRSGFRKYLVFDAALVGGRYLNALKHALRAPVGDFAKKASTDPS